MMKINKPFQNWGMLEMCRYQLGVFRDIILSYKSSIEALIVRMASLRLCVF